MSSKMSADLEPLFLAAKNARLNSYSPYSGHKVGAAIRTRGGKIYAGCNVENSSYGGTVCAERVAIQTAIAQEGSIEITEVLVITDATPPWPPCGICRQVIAEFSHDAKIHAVNLQDQVKTMALSELFPDAFTPNHVKKR